MTSRCLIKLPHKTDHCDSSDGLQVFEDDNGRITGYCFVCKTFVPNPDINGVNVDRSKIIIKTEEEIQEELDFISSLPSLDLSTRKLKNQSLSYYNVKVGVSEEDGLTPEYVYFPYTKKGKVVRYKARLLSEKRMWAVGTEKDVDLFGWEQAKASGAKRLIITEGEFDTVALHRIFEMYTEEKYKDTVPAIVSVVNGASGAVKDIGRNIKEIRKYFKEVALCFDDDEAGKAAVLEVCKAFPEFQVIHLPGKDANDCILKGIGKAARNACVFKAEKPKNSRLINAKTLFQIAKAPAVMGFSWPWEHLTRATKGIRLGETIYIGAGQKQGKSEIVNTLAAHFITKYGWKVLLAKPEEVNKKTVKLVAGKVAGKRFHDPDVPFDEKSYDVACDRIGDHLFLIDLYQHLGYETLRDDIRAAAADGVKAVFIDPITNLVNGLSAAEQNVKLQEIAQDLSALAIDLDIVIFIFCHLKNPDAGPPHERGGKVESHQFSGSRAMARSCNLMLGLEGNRDPDLPKEERNMKTLVLLEDREFGNVGRFKLYWDDETTLFNEVM